MIMCVLLCYPVSVRTYYQQGVPISSFYFFMCEKCTIFPRHLSILFKFFCGKTLIIADVPMAKRTLFVCSNENCLTAICSTRVHEHVLLSWVI